MLSQKTYLSVLAIILFVVIAAMYLQFKTFGSNQYWVYVIILILGWIASKWLVKVQTGSYNNYGIDWKEIKKFLLFKKFKNIIKKRNNKR